MSIPPDEAASLSPVKRAYLALERAQRKIDALERARSEPIAIVGMACRFPGGADSPDTFWRLLAQGVDAVGEIPPGRWDVAAYYDPDPAVPGKMSMKRGGFLKEPVDEFDPQLFGISPREAEGMDPQQRLLLELAWEALENAAQMDERLAGSPTGVFVGITSHDYADLLHRGDLDRVGMHTITGTTHNAAAGRLSYVLGLHGPCMAIDTACSSSLVALHVACNALLNDECRRVLVGGVNLMLSPMATIALSQGRVLAPDGVCRAFDKAASGMVRGEGGAMLVLKRLSAAVEDGDTIHALIRATAVNQDGPSSGLTVPNGPAQEALIRRALANARLSPDDIDYIEAHGTGTPLGDPIELQALAKVFTTGRERPLLLGSVKTNIGHLEACSGLAGLIKAVLSLEHQYIPPHLHFEEPTPHVPWAELPFEVPVRGRPWPAGERPRLAGVSSFGFSGVNAHVILQEAPAEAPPAAQDRDPRPLHLLALSARSGTALHDLAGRYRRRFEDEPGLVFADACHSANAGRVHAGHRLALLAASAEEAASKLAAFSQGTEADGIIAYTAETTPHVAFLFTGQGSQAVGMGRELYDTHPLFRQVIDQCGALLEPHLDRSLRDVLYPAPGEPSPLSQTTYAQPALFALEYALAQLWISWGIRPSLVIGHSLGEYVAACVAGVFSLEDGLKLVAQRAALMQSLPRDGAMAAVLADEAEVEAAIRPHADQVSIAAYNGPRNIVISGRREALDSVLARLQEAGIRTQALNVSHAFHSPLVDPILDRFEDLVRQIPMSPPRIGLVSNLDGRPATGEIATAAYWRRHLRQPVRFRESVDTILVKGCTACIELGPKPTLLGLARQCTDDDGLIWLPSLRPGQPDWRQLLESLGTLYVRGAPVDWTGFDRPFHRRRIPLPTYPFQRRRYWMDIPVKPPAALPAAQGGHPLLGVRLDLPGTQEIRFTARISLDTLPYLRDHRVFGAPVLPAAGYLEMAAAAAKEVFGDGPVVLENIAFRQPLILEEQADQTLHLVLTPEGADAFAFAIHSKDDSGSGWVRHVTGRLVQSAVSGRITPLTELKEGAGQAVKTEEIYRQCEARGIGLGPGFRALRRLWVDGHAALAELGLPDDLTGSGYRLHPVLLDGAFQAMGGVFKDLDSKEVHLPVALDRLHLLGSSASPGWSHVQVRPIHGSAGLSLDVSLYDSAGQPLARLEGLQFARTRPEQFRPGDEFADWLYEVEWQPLHLPPLAADCLPGADEIRRAILPELARAAFAQDSKEYEHAIAAAEAHSVDYIVMALRRLGWTPAPGETATTDALATRLGIADRHRRLFARLLEILTEAGGLRRTETGWEVIALDEPAELDASMDALQAQYPSAAAELALLRRCGTRLAEVLSGRCDPLGLLFPQSGRVTAATLYGETPPARAANGAARDLLESFVRRLPAEHTLRVLEIGAGTGATTAGLLPILPAARTEYTFTDIAPLFVNQAAEKFAAYPFVRTAPLDIERDPMSQGFRPHAYDLVVAANVLHATADLAQALAHVRRLLAPGGLLVLLEGTAPLRFIDLTFGLLDGWWRFADLELRPKHPLLPVTRWRVVLEASGFEPLGEITAPEEADGLWSKQALLVARARPALRCAGQRWLILSPGKREIGQELQGLIESAGGEALVACPGPAYSRQDEKMFQIDPGSPGDYRRLLQEAGAGRPFTHIAHLSALDAAPPEALTPAGLESALDRGCAALVELLKAVLEAGPPPALWVATREAQRVGAEDTLQGLAQAPLWGLAKAAALEYPDLVLKRVDLDELDDAAQALFDLIARDPAEDQIALRQGRCHVPRLARYQPPAQDAVPVRSNGCYLITGGLRGLGLETARWLAAQGAKSLVLTGRGAPTPEAEAQLAELRNAGVRVEAVRADAGDETQMAALLARIKAGQPPLRGVVHSAGQLDDGVLVQQDKERLRRVFAAKVQGAWHLHRLTLGAPLDFFVMYSSMAALLGSAGQANHAAANAFLDMLAHYRRSLGLPGLSIDWGAWSEIGAAAEHERSRRIQDQGMGLIAPRQGMAILERLLAEGAVQVGAAPIDWTRFAALSPAGRKAPFLSRFIRSGEPSGSVEPARTPRAIDLEGLREAAPSERQARLAAFVREQVAGVLRLPAEEVDLRRPLNRLGLDSLMAVELRNRLRGRLGVDLPLVRFMEDISIDDLATELSAQITGPEADRANPADRPNPPPLDGPLDAEALLARLDDLTEEQVDALLNSALAEDVAVTHAALGSGQ